MVKIRSIFRQLIRVGLRIRGKETVKAEVSKTMEDSVILGE